MITWFRHLTAAAQGWLDGSRVENLKRHGIDPPRDTRSRFIAMPWDVGLFKLRTDRYLALADHAQVHYLCHHRLAWFILRRRIAVINKSVSTRHLHPVRLGDVVDIHTRVHRIDDHQADFVHDFYARGRLCARTEVQVVYRQDRRPLAPRTVLPHLHRD